MISRNTKIEPLGDDWYSLDSINDPELTTLYAKYAGVVSVKIGRPEVPGSEQQNRATHALLTAFYVSGFASIPETCTLAEFKIRKKLEFGPVYEIEYKGEHVKIPKSWSDYSKQERRDFIDGLIAEVIQSGAAAASPKIQEILAGMEANNVPHGIKNAVS